MKVYARFVAIGSVFATVEEFLTIVVLQHDVGSYVFTLLILFPVFLTVVFLTSKLLDRLWRTEAARALFHYGLFGGVGLLFEWFGMGLSPWSNPAANPLLMLAFQLGMFSFWSTVAFAPRLFTTDDELAGKTRRSIKRFYVPYFILVYLVALSVPMKLKFVTIIPAVILGYGIVNMYFAVYFVRRFLQQRAVIPSE